MNNPTIKVAPEAAIGLASATLELKKDWTKPTLDRFDIASATQNAGNQMYDDAQHAPAQS